MMAGRGKANNLYDDSNERRGKIGSSGARSKVLAG